MINLNLGASPQDKSKLLGHGLKPNNLVPPPELAQRLIAAPGIQESKGCNGAVFRLSTLASQRPGPCFDILHELVCKDDTFVQSRVNPSPQDCACSPLCFMAENISIAGGSWEHGAEAAGAAGTNLSRRNRLRSLRGT